MQEYRRKRNNTVEAVRHTGSDESATVIADWIRAEGGRVNMLPVGSFSDDLFNSYLQLDTPRTQNLIIPGSWVVKVADGEFFTVNDHDFHVLYDKVESEEK